MEEDSCISQPVPCSMGRGTPVITTSSSIGVAGDNALFPSYSTMLAMSKDWPNQHRHPHPFHFLPSTDSCSPATPGPSVEQSGPEAVKEEVKLPQVTITQPSENYCGGDTLRSSCIPQSSKNINSSSQFKEVIEMLLVCYLKHGGSAPWDEFRNLVGVFLYPVFESLHSLNDKNEPVDAVEVAGPSGSLPSEVLTYSSFTRFSSGPTFVSKADGASVSSDKELEPEPVGDTLSCPVCYGVLIDPVTIPCGHCYCKKCLQKESAGNSCRRCKQILTTAIISQCKTNVVVGALVERWWRDDVKATRLRGEGIALFEEKKVEKALRKFTDALNLAPDDHLTLSNRSQALLTAGKSEEALQDAELATKSCPIWPQGYFAKSAALISLGRYEDAFLSLTVCMYLMKTISCLTPSTCSKEDPAQTQVVNEMMKIIQKLFLQSTTVTGSTLKRHNAGDQLQFAPYPKGSKLTVPGRHERRRTLSTSNFTRPTEWNDLEGSSGDECDQPLSQSYSTSSDWCWKSSRQYAVHPQPYSVTPKQCSTAPVVEQISVRMNRLFARASQDLIAFESRLKKLTMNSSPRNVDAGLVSTSDLECSLCYRLLFQPVSTGCGHTFCRSCLDRCLDHNPSCPLCKTSLQNYLASGERAVTEFLESALRKLLPKEFEERRSQHLEELNSAVPNCPVDNGLNVDIPIFVCTMAFPTVPCPLHVFEPRYRLMIRRCMENGSNRFGMCCYLAENENNYGEIGTLLEIKTIQYFPDGRSVVDTVGCRRFKVLRKTVVDGYNAASIELLHDLPVDESEISVLNDLHNKVFEEATEWLQSIGNVRRQRIHSHFGQMPPPEENWLNSPDGPSWTWWLLAILPLDSKAQLSILSMSSLQKRLECILKVLKFVKSRIGSIGE